MLKIKLVEQNEELIIQDYVVTYPFLLYRNSVKKIKWNLNSLESKNIQNSFNFSFQKKIERPNEFDALKRDIFLFPKRLLFYINEKNVDESYNGVKKILMKSLLVNKKEAKEHLNFTLEYKDNAVLKNKEEITIYLNLYDE